MHPCCYWVGGRKSRVCIYRRRWQQGQMFRNGERVKSSQTPFVIEGKSIGSRSSVNTLCLSSHSTSRPMGAESVTTVGLSVVNICLTRRPASLGDCPAFSLPCRSCCSNWRPRSEWSRCATHLSPDSSHSPNWASHLCWQCAWPVSSITSVPCY